MRVRTIAMLAMLAMLVLMARPARADQENQAIKVKFSQAVQIPGQVLSAGTYWFAILNTNDRETVQVLNENRSKTLAILGTINCERPATGGPLAFTLAEANWGAHGDPGVVLSRLHVGPRVPLPEAGVERTSDGKARDASLRRLKLAAERLNG